MLNKTTLNTVGCITAAATAAFDGVSAVNQTDYKEMGGTDSGVNHKHSSMTVTSHQHDFNHTNPAYKFAGQEVGLLQKKKAVAPTIEEDRNADNVGGGYSPHPLRPWKMLRGLMSRRLLSRP